MEEWFEIDSLEVERLLADWRWLCPSRMTLLAKNVFGELFLQDEVGAVFWLNTTTGELSKVSHSKTEFLEMSQTMEKQGEWFVKQEARAYAQRGLDPSSRQCIGFIIPAVFTEGGTPETAYTADLYEYVSFPGELHRQMADQPNGSKVRLNVSAPKPSRGGTA